MLTKIVMDGPATFRESSTLSTDKKINLIYGLNGSGKSTICKYLGNMNDVEYSNCSITGQGDLRIVVFNEDFVRENFFESDTVKGIFSLSKENKDAEAKIKNALAKKVLLNAEIEVCTAANEDRLKQLEKELVAIKNKAFDIKRKYSGGDRIMEFCLEGVINSKDRLFERLTNTSMPGEEPTYSDKDLEKEARLLTGADMSRPVALVTKISLDVADIEQDQVLSTPIFGGGNSPFAKFIDEHNCSDWVRAGMSYVEGEKNLPLRCPFCQERSISEQVVAGLESYFDKTYENQVEGLKSLYERYLRAVDSLPETSALQESIFYSDTLGQRYAELQATLRGNVLLLQSKLDSPSSTVDLVPTSGLVSEIQSLIRSINEKTIEYNDKLANKGRALDEISGKFWTLMRWQYDQSISIYRNQTRQGGESQAAFEEKVAELQVGIKEQDNLIGAAQQETVNIDAAITSINNELANIGIEDFRIEKHSDHLYRLQRPSGGAGSFRSLSEGERMIISLLYFCELCAGSESRDASPGELVVVLDDPVSSMSHIFVFNVGRLIMARFFGSDKVRQVFVFTHSLYFFYELTYPDHKRRSETQSLFRVVKNRDGSKILPMRYEDIRNDYQSYWQVVNDPDSPPALIANCMRNIVEYFFGFVEKKDFNNVFQDPALRENKFQAFSRYVNRESHSFGQNVFDLKEFDYSVFREGLGLIFQTCGYGEHFEQMSKVGVTVNSGNQ